MLHVTPAYGRDYKSKAAIIADWAAGKDFRICDMSHPNDGAYVNVADYPSGQLQVRFAQLRKVVIIDASAKPAQPPDPSAPADPNARKRGELRIGDRVKLRPNVAAATNERGKCWTLSDVGDRFVKATNAEWPNGRTFARSNVVRVSS